MAILGSASFGRLSRNPAAWWNPGLDWTTAWWARMSSPASILWLYSLGGYPTPYLGVGQDVGNNSAWLFCDNGTYDEAFGGVLDANWHHYAVRYTAAGTLIDLLQDGAVVASLTKSAAPFVGLANEYLLNDGGGPLDSTSAAYFRRWQAALSDAEILLEMDAANPVRTADLLSSTPLPNISDVTDYVGTYDWTAAGTLLTVDGPDLAIRCPKGSLMFAVLSPDCYSAFVTVDGVRLTPPILNPSHCPYSGPEEGIIALDAGTIAINNFQDYRTGTFAADLSTAGVDAADLFGIASNYTDTFYGLSIVDWLGGSVKIQAFNHLCVMGDLIDLAAVATGSRGGFGIAPDESAAYFANTSFSFGHTVTKRDLVGLTNSAFATELTGVIAFRGGIVVLRDNTVLIGWAGLARIKHYDPDGTVLHTYTLPGNADPVCLTPGTDGTTFWVSYFSVAGPVAFQEIRVSDGVVLHAFAIGDGGATGYQWDAPFCILRKAIGPVTPTTTTPEVLRFVRRWAHVHDKQTLLRISRIEFEFQRGVGIDGSDQGADPQLMFRYSTNGGMSFHPERWGTMGKIGQYVRRAVFYNLGQARDWVFEIVVSDPVQIDFTACYLVVDAGAF